MSHSIRGRLLVTVVAVVAPLVVVLAGLLFWALQAATWEGLDDDLVDLGAAMQELVEYDEEGYEFELTEEPPPLTRGEGRSTWVSIRGPNDEIVSGSEETASIGMALAIQNGVPRTVMLDGGREIRLVSFQFIPRVDEDTPPDFPPPGQLTMFVARETAATRAMLMRVGTWFAALGLISLGAAVFAASWAIRRGLVPVRAVARSVETIDAGGLDARVDPDGVPDEMRTIVAGMNGLLDRLEEAFGRERRFTADVAHEIRTPLSLMRTSLELGLRRERTPDEYRGYLAESLRAVEQLSTLVEDLFALAKLDEGQVQLDEREVNLATLVEECWASFDERARRRGVRFTSEVGPDVTLTTDRKKLKIIVSNFLSNAASYTEEGGWVRVDAGNDDTTLVAVRDSGPPIPRDQLPRVFDRFWRAEGTRSQTGEHTGIGLSLVRAIAKHLGLRASAEVADDGVVSFVLRRGTDAAA